MCGTPLSHVPAGGTPAGFLSSLSFRVPIGKMGTGAVSQGCAQALIRLHVWSTQCSAKFPANCGVTMTETGQSNHRSQSVTTFLNQLGKNHQEKPERNSSHGRY